MKTPEQKGKGAFVRMCVSCGIKQHKDQMIRLTNIENTIQAVLTNTVCGRSVYLCNNEKCIAIAAKSHKPEKCLKCQINPNLYDNLLRENDERKI